MLGFDDDDHPKRIECLLDAVLDLRRQTLLYLQATSEDINDTGELGESRDIPIRDIADVYLAEEGEDMVLTERIEVNVLDDDHLPVFLAEHRRAEDLLRVLSHPRRQELHRLSYTLRSLDEPFTLGVFP